MREKNDECYYKVFELALVIKINCDGNLNCINNKKFLHSGILRGMVISPPRLRKRKSRDLFQMLHKCENLHNTSLRIHSEV